MPQLPKYLIPDLDSLVEKIGGNITKIRKAKGLTQKDLAVKIGISQRLLSHFEVGRRRITSEMLFQIALSLNVSADKILGLNGSVKDSSPISPSLIKRIHEIEMLPLNEKRALVKTIDNFLKANKKAP
jgi:transcriptional regulator with XRE-family HTH domain